MNCGDWINNQCLSYLNVSLNPSSIFSKLAYILSQTKTSIMPINGQDLSRIHQNALVTGASSGIGRAIADLLVQEGIQVTGTSRFPQARPQHGPIRWIHFDGSSESALNAFCEINHNLLTNIDILINNSGSALFGKASEIPPDAAEKESWLLTKSPVTLTGLVLPHMERRRNGAIVNVSSLAALFPLPYMENYSRCKAELSRFTQQLMLRQGEKGVVILDFQAGDYRTAFNRNMTRHGVTDRLQDRVWEQMERNLNHAPLPERAAKDILRALVRGKSGTIRSGSFFQSKIAPLGKQLLPGPVINWAIRKYYHLP